MSSRSKPRAALDSQAPLVRQLWTNPDPTSDGAEFLLYSDADVPAATIDEWRPHGEPLHLFATRARIETLEAFAPKLALRVYHSQPLPPWRQENRQPRVEELLENTPWWTGMTLDQEAAALISLVSGVRMRSGGLVRRIPAAGGIDLPDYQHHRMPSLPDVPWTHRVLPGLAGQGFDARAILLLGTLPQMSAETAGTLVKAAGAYADAMWIADSDPVQGWLRMVTAAETVADFIGLDDEGAEAQFRRENPKAAKLLDERGEGLTAEVAELMKDKMGAGAKFRNFFQAHLPEPPARRPAEVARQVRWDWTVAAQERRAGVAGLKDTLSKIYEHRSNFLHAGTPFPPALLDRPEEVSAEGSGPRVLAERPPHNLTHVAGGNAWSGSDSPMYLHVFADFVRHALLRWWLAQQTTINPAGLDTQAEQP
jgi:hypothetical protein